MFHCHLLLHEDEGLMGQFVVTDGPPSRNSRSLPDVGGHDGGH
jgi:hypothetical protein